MLRKFVWFTLALMSIDTLASPAWTQDTSGATADVPEATTAAYRDWTLRCDHIPETPPRRVCEIVQAVRAADGQQVLAQVVIGRPAADRAVKLIIQLPAGVWLPAGVTLVAASGERVSANYTQCMQVCVAETDIGDEVVSAMRLGNEPAKLSFQDGNRRVIELPISLNGFTAAISQALAAN